MCYDIPKEEQEKLFTPFDQKDSPTAGKYHSKELELPIVKKD